MRRRRQDVPPDDEGRPSAGAPSQSNNLDNHSVGADVLAALDATAERLRGHLVLQVVVDDNGHLRTTIYRSAAPAERAIKRARARGRTAHLTLVQMVPVGVVVGLDGGLR